VSSTSAAPAPPAPAIESGGAGGSLSSVPSTELDDEAVAELRDDTAEEAAALLADERVRGAKKFAFLAARWLAASAWAVRFFAAFTAVAAALSVLPVAFPCPSLNSAK
jgi:hypothetical protein